MIYTQLAVYLNWTLYTQAFCFFLVDRRFYKYCNNRGNQSKQNYFQRSSLVTCGLWVALWCCQFITISQKTVLISSHSSQFTHKFNSNTTKVPRRKQKINKSNIQERRWVCCNLVSTKQAIWSNLSVIFWPLFWKKHVLELKWSVKFTSGLTLHCKTFLYSSPLTVSIFCFFLPYIIVNYTDWTVGRTNKTFEDVPLSFRKLWWSFFTKVAANFKGLF